MRLFHGFLNRVEDPCIMPREFFLSSFGLWSGILYDDGCRAGFKVGAA